MSRLCIDVRLEEGMSGRGNVTALPTPVNFYPDIYYNVQLLIIIFNQLNGWCIHLNIIFIRSFTHSIIHSFVWAYPSIKYFNDLYSRIHTKYYMVAQKSGTPMYRNLGTRGSHFFVPSCILDPWAFRYNCVLKKLWTWPGNSPPEHIGPRIKSGSNLFSWSTPNNSPIAFLLLQFESRYSILRTRNNWLHIKCRQFERCVNLEKFNVNVQQFREREGGEDQQFIREGRGGRWERR